MLKAALLLVLLFQMVTFATNLQKMKIFEKGKFVSVEIYQVDKNTFMNKKCLESKKCQKLKVLGNIKSKLVGHPASKACKSIVNSEYKILKMQNGDQMGFCRFADGSMKSAWSLIHD